MTSSSQDWIATANRLRAILPRERLDGTVFSFLEERHSQPCVIACSGGADSTCLTLLASGSFPERDTPLVLAHFNHALRGEDSKADQCFVEDMAKGLGLEFELGHGSFLPDQLPSEAELRDERHSFLQEVCRKHGADHLLLGHHLDDVAETILMRLPRGSGTEGLAAPRPLHLVDDLWRVRPLLTLSRVQVREALQEAGATWREDASNSDPGPFRNRVRKEVLPRLAEASPSNLLTGFERSRALLEEDASALQTFADEAFPELLMDDGSLDAISLRALPPALIRRVLRCWMISGDASDALSAKAFDDFLLDLAAGRSRKTSLGRNRWVQVSDEKVFFVEESLPSAGWGPCALPTGVNLFLPRSGILRMEPSIEGEAARRVLSKDGVDERREALIDADCLKSPLTVRTWLPGDRYAPLGAPGSRKLQDLFTDRKVPAPSRQRLPVILSGGGEITWCPGLPPAESCRITSGTSTVLRLTFEDTEALF